MTDKTTLHQLIEELPESETDEERQAVQDAYEELARGDTIPDTDLWRVRWRGLSVEYQKGLEQEGSTDDHPEL